MSFKKRTKSDTFRANLYVEGRLSISGKKFLYIESADAAAYLPQIAMIDDRLSKEILAQQGVIMPSPAWRELQELAFCISQFEPDLIADRPGWNGDAFVFTENDVIAADEKEIKVVAVDIDPRRSAKSGTLDGWLDEVAEPLSGQSLPMFLIMAVLTAPLLQLIQRRENPAFETSGRPGCGKSTLLIIISSVSGEASVEMFNVTLDGLESSMCASSGQPLILDEANLFYGDESSTKRVAKWKALPFRLANGQDKKRYGVEQGDRSYFTTLIATNEPMTKLIAGENPAVIAAAADRLLALVIAEDRPYQTFDFVPKGYESAGSFAKALERGASANHGHAMARFVRGLVDELAKDRQALVDRINADIGLWKRRVGVTDDDGSISRTGDTFGLCYAAGEEAKRHGALPASWRCGQAVESVYRTLYKGPKPPPSFDKLFAAYLRQPGVRDLDETGLKSLSDARFEATAAFLKTNRKGQLEALVHEAGLDEAIPGWDKLISNAGTKCVLDRDKDHLTKKRVVRRGGDDRMVVIVLPEGFLG